MTLIAAYIDRALLGKDDPAVLAAVRQEVANLCERFPMPH